MNIFKTVKRKVVEKKPEIALVVGLSLGVATVILACKGKPEADKVAESGVEVVTTIKSELEKETDKTKKKEYNKDLMNAYATTGVGIAKAYGPAVLTGTASILCILYSYGVLKKRNTELLATCSTSTSGFMAYKKRVAERFGEAVEMEIAMDAKKEKVKVVQIDEDANEKMVKKDVYTHADPCDPFTFVISADTADCWSNDSDITLFYISSAIKYAAEELDREKNSVIFLNEILAKLGVKNRPLAGQLICWKNDENYKGLILKNTETDSNLFDGTVLVTPYFNHEDVVTNVRHPRVEFLVEFKPSHMFTMDGKEIVL